MKGSFARFLFNLAVPEVGDGWLDVEDYNRRTDAYFEMKRWWTKLNGGKRDGL